jgi:hypothetical protein
MIFRVCTLDIDHFYLPNIQNNNLSQYSRGKNTCNSIFAEDFLIY